MTAAEFELALRQDGFNEVLTRELPAGFSVAEHAHPFDVRALVLAGEITLTVDGLGRAYREGDVFVMPAGRPHQENVGPSGVHYVAGRRVAEGQS
jgi:quercetin dioxygenase-like cupin family protein